MNEAFTNKYRYDIGFLNGLFALASSASTYIGRDDVTVYLFPKEDTVEEFRTAFKLRVTVEKEPVAGDLKSVLGEWYGTEGNDRRITQKLVETIEYCYGTPEAIYSVKNYEKVTDRLEGRKGYAPYFFVSDFFFADFKQFAAFFIMGNNE